MTTNSLRSIARTAVGLALAVSVAGCNRIPGAGGSPSPESSSLPASSMAAATPSPAGATEDPFSWAWAVARVEERRGGGGPLAVPPELRHADDRRVFLAVQMADSRSADYAIPHDHAELIEMIRAGQFVPLRALGTDHILYDVGTDAREDPLAHFDDETGRDVPLYPSREAFEAAAPLLARETRELAERYYRDPALSEQLFREFRGVTTLASNFDGQRFDLADPEDRTRFQVRLLSYMRPEARDVMLEVAAAYRQRFDRLLPVTSLVRTARYQRRLGRVNRNVAKVDIPPHGTGMAFDVSYKFMSAEEQNFVMDHLARLEREGRVEALRERLNHIHVYAFADGQRPPQQMVADFLPVVEAAHPGSAPRASRDADDDRRGRGR